MTERVIGDDQVMLTDRGPHPTCNCRTANTLTSRAVRVHAGMIKTALITGAYHASLKARHWPTKSNPHHYCGGQNSGAPKN
jgi:hypothetical protein